MFYDLKLNAVNAVFEGEFCHKVRRGSAARVKRNFKRCRAAVNGFENIHDRMPAIIPLENAGSWLQDVADAIGGAVTDLAAEER